MRKLTKQQDAYGQAMWDYLHHDRGFEIVERDDGLAAVSFGPPAYMAPFKEWPTLQKKVHSKVVQMYAMGWHADYPDAENFLQLYYSPNIKRGTNNSNYRNAEFDKLFKQAATIMDEQQRISLYARMGKILNEDAPVLLLTEPIGYILLYEWVRNDKPHPIGYGFRKYIHIDAKLRREMGGR